MRIFSDAFSFHNGKPDQISGYVTLAVNDNNEIVNQIVKGFDGTTNNFGELMGILEGLNYIYENYKELPKTSFELISDSEYAIKGASERIYKWAKNSWKGYDGKTVKNLEIWQKLYEYMTVLTRSRVNFKFKWVKGHNGKSVTLEEDSFTYFQEMCDTLAVEYKNKILKERNLKGG